MPGVENVKQQAGCAVEKPQQPGKVLATDIKQCVTQLTRDQPGSVMKKISASKESGRRMTFAARGLPSTAKKVVSERARPRNLTRVKNENICTSQGSPARANKAVKR